MTSVRDSAASADADHPGRHLDAREFKDIFRGHPAGVAVVTVPPDPADPGSPPVGFTATSVISVSAAPPMLAFSVTNGSSSQRAVARASSLVVNFLSAESAGLARSFARRGVDRFAGVDWWPLPTGEPVLAGADRWLRCTITDRIRAGDSALVLLLAHEAGTAPDAGAPLVYHDRTFHILGEHSRSDA